MNLSNPLTSTARSPRSWLWLIPSLTVAACLILALRSDNTFSFGQADLGTPVIHEFSLPNPYSETLFVSAITSPRPEASVLAFDSTIPPHGRGLVRVALRSSRVGPVRISFHVSYGGPRRGMTSLGLAGTITTPTLPTTPTQTDSNLLVSASQVLTELSDPSLPQPTFIDLRPSSHYQTAHIKTALNLPTSQLKGATFLKHRPLVLIDEGHSPPTTTELAQSLLTSGFASVRILDGGTQAWRSVGGELSGSGSPSLPTLPPAALFETAHRPQWSIINLSTHAPRFPSLHPSETWDPRLTPSQITTRLLQRRSDSPHRFLILTDEGQGSEPLRQALHAHPELEVFFIQGGWAGLEQELLHSVHASLNPTTTRLNASETTVGGRVTRSLGGCGSCN